MPTRRDRANAIRALAMDAVQRAASGHPGAPMGMADLAEVLWRDHLRHDPADPNWFDRDRFVLSNGHASMLLYALLHLTGYELSLDDLKDFRQLHSRTAGHPEFGEAPGIETTTGPLGQGFANAVGMALAEKILAARYNRADFPVVNHRTWVFCGDGCLMEGISHEAASLAGTHRLGKLICLYDDNHISIDGDVSGWFTDDTAARFEAYGWQVVRHVDGHDPESVSAAISTALAETERPTLLMCRTVIGFGSPKKAGTADAHGAPLGDDEVAAAREQLGWSHPPFEIPESIRAEWDARRQGAQRHAEWDGLVERYRQAHPELAAEFERVARGELPAGLEDALLDLARATQAEAPKIATRQASKKVLDLIGARMPELLGGSADLTGSNGTLFDGARVLGGECVDAQYVHWGVREFAMTAACNGIALHGGLVPYSATFLVFMDYGRNAVRLSALMGIRHVLVYTHDSLALGEDGPTHQPVEQLATLRMTPNLETWRPCDQVETVFAWHAAVTRTDGPTALVLSRQGLPCAPRSDAQLEAVARGGYVLREGGASPACVLVATGSEVALALETAERLAGEGVELRVVSVPCLERFLAQDEGYRASVLPAGVPRLALEAGHPMPWWRIVGERGDVLGIDRFGLSGPGPAVMAEYGFEPEAVAARVRALVSA
ncbi:MAG: transketolase [Pseudomonadales bacterium]|jgi:transketolase|nr:transketolase [Pseudomonadales bacterium]